MKFVDLPGALTYCLSSGKIAYFIELSSMLIEAHPSGQTVKIDTGTSYIMSRQSIKLQHNTESLILTIKSLGKHCLLSGLILTMATISEHLSCLFSLHQWLQNFCAKTDYGLIRHLDSFWTFLYCINWPIYVTPPLLKLTSFFTALSISIRDRAIIYK